MAEASYWNCPICLRRVPARVSECYCGRKRQPQDGPDTADGEGGVGRGPLALGAAFVLLAAFASWTLRRPEPAASIPPPVSSAPRGPERHPPAAPALPRSTPPPSWGDVGAPTPAPLAAEPAVVDPMPKPSPTPSDSADAMRQRGAAAFEAALKNLSGRLGSLRSQLNHFNSICPPEQTQVIGCDTERGKILEAAAEIRTTLESAEEAARRAWLEPGAQRAIRERSGMDDIAVSEVLSAANALSQR